MIQILKFVGIVVGSVLALVLFAVSCLILMLFPEWVRWTAAGLTTALLVWYIAFGRFRRKSGLLINDGTVYDRWRLSSKPRKDFL